MKIDEFRAQNPEYDDLSDTDLAEKLHQKFYSDLPREQFDAQFLGREPLPWSRVPAEAVRNLPGSAVEFGKTVAQPILHPIETAKGVSHMVQGAFAEAGLTKGDPEDKAAFDAFVNALQDRYGSVENLKRTMAEDPVGFASDASVVLGGAGAAVRGAGAAAGVASGVKAGEAAMRAGAAVNPIMATGRAVTGLGRAGAKAAQKLGVTERLYQSAVKPSTTLTPEARTSVLQTGLREGVMPTKEGLNVLRDKIDYTDYWITKKVTDNAANGKAISTERVVNRIDDLKKFYSNVVGTKDYVSDLTKLQNEFRALHGKKIPVDKAQELKQNTYKLLRQQYDKMSKQQPADLKTHIMQGQKSIVRGIKEELVKQMPELQKLNEHQGKLLELEKAIERAVGRIDNKDLVGIGSTLAGAAGAAVTGSPAAGFMSMMAKALADHPKIKAAVAIQLKKAATQPGKPPRAATGRAGLALFQAGRVKQTAPVPAYAEDEDENLISTR